MAQLAELAFRSKHSARDDDGEQEAETLFDEHAADWPNLHFEDVGMYSEGSRMFLHITEVLQVFLPDCFHQHMITNCRSRPSSGDDMITNCFTCEFRGRDPHLVMT